MKRLLAVALIVVATLIAIPAHAAPVHAAPVHADDTGVSLALRASYGLPTGDVATAQALSDRITGNVPLGLDIGYRFNKNVLAGAYFQYGLGFVNGLSFVKNCPSTASCSSSIVRFGIEGIYNFIPDAVIAPWAGLGIGYEILNTSVAGYDSSVRGFEFLNLQLGGDLSVNALFSIGPFMQFSLARYSTASAGGASTDITAKSSHEWWQFGLKGTFKL